METPKPAPTRAQQRLHAARAALHARYVTGPVSQAVFEFIAFGIKQGWACLFGGLMLGLLLLTFVWYPDGALLSRYDFLVLGALAIQIMMLWTGLETWEEARIILVFHVVGTVMELFKTAHGSWIYPEDSFLRIGAVPLFTGFMYGAVGSYLARVWRIFEFRFDRFPPLWLQGLLATAIYVNFFAHHWLPDVRIALFVAYPGQEHGWQMVSLSKLGSWYLLMIISFVLVAAVHGKAHRAPGGPRIEDPEAARRE